MIHSYSNILTEEDINYILNIPQVIDAKNSLNKTTKDSIYFSIDLPQSIKDILFGKLNLNLTNLKNIPMKWIKGDTPPHIDTGLKSFYNTHLMYLTNSEGELVIENNSYPITKGTVYVFNEGLCHKTINTGLEPRLLLGPMSEEGFAVGSVISRPGGTTIYFRQTTDIQYSIDNQSSWINIGNNYPLNIVNNNTAAGMLKIEFVTDITFDNTNGGIYKYFISGSSHIQFGSESLKNDGSRPIITIDGVANYPGLIQNGSSGLNGLNNIYIFNLVINTINGSTLISDAGWFGHSYFGKAATNNYIINCSSTGSIIDGGGGILGGYSGSDGAELYITGCSSSGTIATYSGGIIGFYSGINGGQVTCRYCWSTGSIGESAGGIFGYSTGNGAVLRAIKCYSTGAIAGQNSGGIYGQYAGNASTAEATDCYSQGAIGSNSGGIFGGDAGINSGITPATNCYSSGTGIITGRGIYGPNAYDDTPINCYVANGNWNDTTANSFLTGLPSSIVGSVWVKIGTNQPYELYNMGYTPYTIINIDLTSSPTLKRTFTETILPNNSTSAATVTGLSYQILEIKNGNSGSYGTITIDPITGVISTTTSTVSAIYNIYIRNTGSYNITEFLLDVQGFIPCLTEDTLVLTPSGYKLITDLNIGDDVTTDDNRNVKIKYISKTVIKEDSTYFKEKCPYIIPKDSIDVNYPKIETKISGDHLIKYKTSWIHPLLSNRFKQDFNSKSLKYYHIELDKYETDNLVINYGFVVESYSGKNNYKNFITHQLRMKNLIFTS